MKKAGFLIIVVIMMFGLTSCQIDTSKWQNVQYDETLTFKVPGKWIVTRTFEGLVFTDRPLEEEGSVIYMIEIHPYVDKDYVRFDNQLIGNGYLFMGVYSSIDSKGSLYSERYVEINEISKVRRLIDFTLYKTVGNDSVEFLFMDNAISKEYVIRIMSTVTHNIK